MLMFMHFRWCSWMRLRPRQRTQRKLDNPIDRYCINDRSGLKANDDGSVDIILSEDAPENTTNWLPVGDGGFHLYMRIYTPDMDVLDTWTAPAITEIAPSNVN